MEQELIDISPEHQSLTPEITHSEIGKALGEDIEEANRKYDADQWRFIATLSGHEAKKIINKFVDEAELTNRARRKLKTYHEAILTLQLSVTFLANPNDRDRVVYSKAVIDSTLKLGLLNRDITPEFMMIIDLISYTFSIKLGQSKGGFERVGINTMRKEVSIEEPTFQKPGKVDGWLAKAGLG